ncbi:MAG: sulfite exporter TauE/SafE family protein [Hyphomicrobium sp.]|nr:sulfite exporter TauE/SafE family protein [Hyphomicrobium sp.]
MASLYAAMIGGVLMGLASALHCGAMCSGVCGSAMLMLQPETGRQRLYNLLMLQAGRITTYAALGAAGALIGSSLITPDIAARFRTMQWAAAIAMMAMGLAMAGMLPRLAIVDRGAVALSNGIERIVAPLKRWPRVAPYALGMMWGANACPMVYGAMFTATLTGSVVGGVTFMTAFGFGTLPALLATGYGLSKLKSLSLKASAQTVGGLAIAAAGFVSLYASAPISALFCITP